MTMTIDANQQRFGSSLHFDHMSSYPNHPQFTNPWVPSSSTAPAPQFVGSQTQGSTLPQLNLTSLTKSHPHSHSSRAATNGASLASYGPLPVVTAASAGSTLTTGAVYGQPNLLSAPQELLGMSSRMAHPTSSAGYETTAYTTTAAVSPVNASYATSPTAYNQLGYGPAPIRSTFGLGSEHSRRYSQQSVASSTMSGSSSGLSLDQPPPSPSDPVSVSASAARISFSDYDYSLQPDDRKSFQDAIEASHGMLSMSQKTPRNIYDVRSQQQQQRNGNSHGHAHHHSHHHHAASDGYGFPAPAAARHSNSSSVSSTGFSSGGYGYGSVDGSVSDYSTGSDIESYPGRRLGGSSRAPGGGLMAPQQHQAQQQPPAPQSMMGSFSSKIASSTQKKHKCKVCDKRFTRPSSLQTHMYSHTGEKPFSCEVEGCGRNFSVVSNLRRHRKVHKGGNNSNDKDQEAQTPSEAGSEDHQSE